MLEKLRSWFSSKKSPVESMKVEQLPRLNEDGVFVEGEYYILLNGAPYAGPYKREQDAKGQLTRLRKGYTPAARKV